MLQLSICSGQLHTFELRHRFLELQPGKTDLQYCVPVRCDRMQGCGYYGYTCIAFRVKVRKMTFLEVKSPIKYTKTARFHVLSSEEGISHKQFCQIKNGLISCGIL
jgi:hypothetical protein